MRRPWLRKFGFGESILRRATGLYFIDESGVEVGIDGHLLTRQGIERESGGDLGDAAQRRG